MVKGLGCGAAICLWAAIAGGCNIAAPVSMTLSPEVKRPAKSAVVFFIDGLDWGRFSDCSRQGLLPNIDRRFVRGGVEVEHAVSVLPSITYPASVSLITGLFPGHHGILGNQWFDRRTLTARDYITASTYRTVNDHFNAPTIYDALSGEFTVNVQCPTRRGATAIIDNPFTVVIDWAFNNQILMDAQVGSCIEEVGRLANRVRRWPALLWVYFPGLDETGHAYGSDSPQYTATLRNADAQIGRVIDAIESAGVGESMYYALVTDHGHVQTGPEQFCDVVVRLEKCCGLKVHQGLIGLDDYAQRFAYLDKYDAVVVNSAYRRIAVHLRGPQEWSQTAAKETIERVVNLGGGDSAECSTPLHELPGVAVVCTRDGADRILVRSARGAVVVQRRGAAPDAEYRLMTAGETGRQPDSTPDPFGYRNAGLAGFVDAGWHPSREWLIATAATGYPDFVPQVAEMFDSPRSGDIVLFADDHWSFDKTSPGGHGSCVDLDMRVPMYFSGPDLPAGAVVDVARLVDVMPTLLELLGQDHRPTPPAPIDGVSVASQLRRAATGVAKAPGIRAAAE